MTPTLTSTATATSTDDPTATARPAVTPTNVAASGYQELFGPPPPPGSPPPTTPRPIPDESGCTVSREDFQRDALERAAVAVNASLEALELGRARLEVFPESGIRLWLVAVHNSTGPNWTASVNCDTGQEMGFMVAHDAE